jgi:hypothetical protein
MRKSIVALIFLISAFCIQARTTAQNDTVTVHNELIERVVSDTTVNSNGKTVVKWYMLYQHQLIPTSKSTVEVYNLCKQYGAECALAMVINRNTGKKRIIRN